VLADQFDGKNLNSPNDLAAQTGIYHLRLNVAGAALPKPAAMAKN